MARCKLMLFHLLYISARLCMDILNTWVLPPTTPQGEYLVTGKGKKLFLLNEIHLDLSCSFNHGNISTVFRFGVF